MKKYTVQIALLLVSLVLADTAFADVKIKSRQTVSGQTYENSTYIKGKRQRSESMNGQMIMITQCDLKRELQLMPQGKVYMINPFDNTVLTTTTKNAAAPQTNGAAIKGGTVKTIITVKDTGERKQMFGYTARHLIMTSETESSPDACNFLKNKIEQDGWYIDAAFALDCDRNYNYANYNRNNQKPDCQDKYDVKQIGTAKRGYPVYEKMTMFNETGKETMTMVNEIVELSNAALTDDLFDVPSDYREVKDQSQLYASLSGSGKINTSSNAAGMPPSANYPAMSRNAKNVMKNSETNPPDKPGAKKEGVVRVGLAQVKTSAVGEGLNAAELVAAIQNTLSEYLKSPKIEVVRLEAKLPSAVSAEARSKECDDGDCFGRSNVGKRQIKG